MYKGTQVLRRRQVSALRAGEVRSAPAVTWQHMLVVRISVAAAVPWAVDGTPVTAD